MVGSRKADQTQNIAAQRATSASIHRSRHRNLGHFEIIATPNERFAAIPDH
jgi:hypothetical protein